MQRAKKGQFFLIAALIIITIILGFGVVYNFTNAPKSSSEDAKSIADAIKYEATQIINNGFYNNVPTENITYNLLNLTHYYSKSYPQYNLTIVYLDSAKQFENGESTSLVTTSGLTETNVTLNNINYSFIRTKGYNFNIIVQKEEDGQRFIATA